MYFMNDRTADSTQTRRISPGIRLRRLSLVLLLLTVLFACTGQPPEIVRVFW